MPFAVVLFRCQNLFVIPTTSNYWLIAFRIWCPGSYSWLDYCAPTTIRTGGDLVLNRRDGTTRTWFLFLSADALFWSWNILNNTNINSERNIQQLLVQYIFWIEYSCNTNHQYKTAMVLGTENGGGGEEMLVALKWLIRVIIVRSQHIWACIG